MKRVFNKAIAAVLTASMVLSLGMPAFATENVDSAKLLSGEASAFLQEHSVDSSIFEVSTLSFMNEETAKANSYDESILSLKDAAVANHFTDEQIQKYVEGLLSTSTTIVSGEEEISLYAENRPGDDGIGYEVKSQSGYYQETAYAILPTVNRATSSGAPSSGYMFYTVSGSDWGIDVGLWYASGNGVEAWRGCYLPQGQKLQSGDVISGLKAGSKVYFNASVETNGYLRFRVLDANDFSTVYYDISYYVGDHSIYRTNASFNRQITLCNDTANFYTGAYLKNGQFSDAYIYSSSGYSKTIASNTLSNRRGAFGTNSTTAQKVTVNSSTPWYAENISISF